jgi:hypothetical protein
MIAMASCACIAKDHLVASASWKCTIGGTEGTFGDKTLINPSLTINIQRASDLFDRDRSSLGDGQCPWGLSEQRYVRA